MVFKAKRTQNLQGHLRGGTGKRRVEIREMHEPFTNSTGEAIAGGFAQLEVTH